MNADTTILAIDLGKYKSMDWTKLSESRKVLGAGRRA
jgi:hypothetical protein